MPPVFTRYQKFVVAVLAFLQFTIILDFMIISPLGALLLRDLHITTRQFGLVVSAYAFSAGRLRPAGRRLRRQVRPQAAAAVLLCRASCSARCSAGVADTYAFLLGARIVTGVFGGVIGSICMAIIADLFPLEMRGRVMGTIQTAFAASQVHGAAAGRVPVEPLGLARPLHHDPGGGRRRSGW